MPISRIEYQILLSSPGDVTEERQVAAEVVAEVSATWGGPAGAVLKLLKWEDVAPAFASEPQGVINAGLGESWDIYLGIMHARFGSPTKRFGSGTEEEFARAHELWNADPPKKRLMFYFKKAPVDFDLIDPAQIEKVKIFKRSLGELGGLYKEFSDAASFRDILRAHLTSVLVELHRSNSIEASSASLPETKKSAPNPEQLETSPGLLDLVESSVLGMTTLGSVINDIANVMTENTAILDREGTAIKDASAAGDLTGMRRGVTVISQNMRSMSEALAERRRAYQRASRMAFESLSTAISMAKAAWPEEVNDSETFSTSISQTIEILEKFIGSISGAERSMDSVPNLAKEFGSARLLLKREFGNLRAELNTSIMLLRDLRAIISTPT